jgi:hypothetical protein
MAASSSAPSSAFSSTFARFASTSASFTSGAGALRFSAVVVLTVRAFVPGPQFAVGLT